MRQVVRQYRTQGRCQERREYEQGALDAYEQQHRDAHMEMEKPNGHRAPIVTLAPRAPPAGVTRVQRYSHLENDASLTIRQQVSCECNHIC